MTGWHGNPNTSPAFTRAVEALYPVAYKLKFASKKELGRDYVVMPLEGLWWAEDMDAFTISRDKSRWDWTLMIMVPDWIDDDLFDAAVQQVAAKSRPDRLDEVRLESLPEGRCVQTLHIGPYDDEAGLPARMHHDFIPAHRLTMVGRHHEIYLSDSRRVAPDKLRADALADFLDTWEAEQGSLTDDELNSAAAEPGTPSSTASAVTAADWRRFHRTSTDLDDPEVMGGAWS